MHSLLPARLTSFFEKKILEKLKKYIRGYIERERETEKEREDGQFFFFKKYQKTLHLMHSLSPARLTTREHIL